MAAFAKGDRVAWSHELATQHAAGSVLRESAVPEPGKGADPGSGQRGTVVGKANDEGTWFDVKLDSGKSVTLTADELVKVTDE